MSIYDIFEIKIKLKYCARILIPAFNPSSLGGQDWKNLVPGQPSQKLAKPYLN
jgi:hypothetical protein